MKTPLTGKTIWITGASSGIGKELALQLADAGNYVIVSARSSDKLNELVALRPDHICALVFDVADDTLHESITQQLHAITDTVDVLIMSAGVAEYEDNLGFDIAMYRGVFDANMFGMINTLAVAKPFLERAQQRAYIVGVTSLSMVIGFSRAQAYGASKAAADYFLHSLIIDLPCRKFDVSVVRPGFIETPMTSINDFPMPFLMTADKAAARIIKGMAKRPRLIVFPRRLNIILKLMSWVPALWYNYLGPKTSRNKL